MSLRWELGGMWIRGSEPGEKRLMCLLEKSSVLFLFLFVLRGLEGVTRTGDGNKI